MIAVYMLVTNKTLTVFLPLFGQLMVLDAVPDLDLVTHLPEFLDGLFNIFKDRSGEIRKMLVTSFILRVVILENLSFLDLALSGVKWSTL